jgi:hypothetical protein
MSTDTAHASVNYGHSCCVVLLEFFFFVMPPLISVIWLGSIQQEEMLYIQNILFSASIFPLQI